MPVHNLGSCIVYMHNGNKTYRVLCQITDMKGYFILGREQAQHMNYTQYPEILPLTCALTPETSLRSIAVESDKRSSYQAEKDCLRQANKNHVKNHNRNIAIPIQIIGKGSLTTSLTEKQPKNMPQASTSHKAGLIEPIVCDIKWRDSEIIANDRVQKNLKTKECLLKEFAHVFQGVESLPGPPCHIRLRENYTPVQHPPQSVPVRM